MKVLLTDYAWPDLEIETRTLAEVGAELVVAPAKDPAALAAAAAGADAIMTNWAKVTQQVIESAPKLRIIARLGIGLDNIDVACASGRRIAVTNIPDYCLIEVAEHALALLLSLARKTAFYHQQTKSGVYDLAAGPQLARIEGQTLGIVGLGNIGSRLAAKAMALGLRVIATSRSTRAEPSGVRFVSLEELLRSSDYVSLHLPLLAQTRHLIGARELAWMKPSAYLINTARGGLIDQPAPVPGAGRGPSGGGRARRAGSRAARLVAGSVERSARDRHSALGVRLARVVGKPAHPGVAAGGHIPDRGAAGKCGESASARS